MVSHGDPIRTHTPQGMPLDEECLASDERRAQELDQYYRPEQPLSLSDTILPAYMQLIAWRLGVQRALVSLIDRDTQFFVSEASRTTDLQDPSMFEDRDDAIWAGNAVVSKSGRLCVETIKASEGPNGEPAYFEVCDLSKDKRYEHMDFVTSKPCFRYYCGVPIRTKRNIAIGSVFALDNRVRDPVDPKLVKFLTVMANNVMVHLEARKEKMDIDRIMKMNKSLAQFVDTESDQSTLSDVPLSTNDAPPAQKDSEDGCTGSQGPPRSQAQAVFGSVESSQQNTRKSSLSSAGSGSDDDVPNSNETRDYGTIFGRAAPLLRESLALQDGGGVTFVDTASIHTSISSGVRYSSQQAKSKRKDGSLHATDPAKPCGLRTPSNESPHENGHKAIAATLARSLCSSSMEITEGQGFEEKSPLDIPVKVLLKFIKKAPSGKIWYYPEHHSGCRASSRGSQSSQNNAEENEMRLLFSFFPGARQLIFIPFWNAHTSRWSVCLAYTFSHKRDFTYEIDFLYCRAFCNCIKAEIDRCAVVLSDQQKGDFIGSISHELRSPLHGILASCELLVETDMTSFQSSLIDTTESCAHTLLDTIDMVLDYSKINAFTKKQPSEGLNIKPHVVKGVEPLLSIYSNVNVAAISEEVIEGVTTGHLAKANPSDRSDPGTLASGPGREPETPGIQLNILRPAVEIILDVSPPRDWLFITQPGSYRRVIMNLFGNALKYTEHGFIKVCLHCEDLHHDNTGPTKSLVVLSVSDSGKGISRSYMQTKMFTAFAQENALAPGIGLGLSLVRSIVDMLDGQIEVQSNLNQGTTVTVKIPMERSSSKTPVRGAFHVHSESDVTTIRDIQPRPRVVLLRSDLPGDTLQQQEARQMQNDALLRYVTGWYDLGSSEDLYSVPRPDLILVDELRLSTISDYLQKFHSSGPAVVVLCSNRAHTMSITKSITYPRLDVMPKPFGPFKLAKALRLALERGASSRSPLTGRAAEISQHAQIRASSPKPIVHGQDSTSLSVVGFPFPSMRITPSSRPLSPVQSESSRPEPNTHHRRLKTLDVPLLKQYPKEKSEELTRSQSDGQIIQEQRHRKPKLLLVDDNEVNLKLLNTFFKRRDYTDVALARDGSEAVGTYNKALQQGDPFHVIFMDISMPVMNGFEATKHIRLIESNIASQRIDQSATSQQSLIIALTGNASADDQARAFTHGIDLYMTKPVSLKEVGELMRVWVELAKIHGSDGARDMMLQVNATVDTPR